MAKQGMTFTFTEDAYKYLMHLSWLSGTSEQEVIKRSLAMYEWFLKNGEDERFQWKDTATGETIPFKRSKT